MKALVLGGTGKIGSVVAKDLSEQEEFSQIGLVGRNKESLEKTKKWIGSNKIVTHPLDLTKKQEVAELMKKYDVGVITLPDRKSDYSAVETAFEVGLNIVDVLEEYHRDPDEYETEGLELPEGMSIKEYGEWLHKKALEKGVTLVDGMGFAPGLSNVTTGQGIKKLNEAKSAIARVGGVPQKKYADNHPLKYMITWAFEHVLREYMVKVKVLQNGHQVLVDAMSDYEEFKFDQLGKNENLECFITPGMPSFIHTRKYLQEFTEKTIRWPGHKQGITTLKETGMLDIKQVDYNGNKIVPREFLSQILTPKLAPSKGEGDACIMWNTIKGIKNGKEARVDYYMWEEADKATGLSGMARTTSLPAAIAAKFLARGDIKTKGIVAPEDCFDEELYKEFISELKKRNIEILEKTNF